MAVVMLTVVMIAVKSGCYETVGGGVTFVML